MPSKMPASVTSQFSTLTTLAKTVAVPHDNPPRRIPTFPALERTAVLGFTDTATVPIAEDRAALLFRHPTFPLWIEGLGAGLYTGGTTLARYFQVTTSITLATGTHHTEFVPDHSVPNYGYTLATTTVPTIVFNNQFYQFIGARGFYGPGDPSPLHVGIQIAASATLGLVAVDWTYLKQDSSGVTPINQTSHVAWDFVGTTFGTVINVPSTAIACRINSIRMLAGASTSIISSIAYGLTSTTASAPGANKAVCLSSPVAFAATYSRLGPAFMTPALSETAVPYQATRATAVACLFSNVTSVLNKEGTVNAARVAVQDYPVFDGPSWDFGKIQPSYRYFGPLEKGLYAYCMPDAQSDLFRDCAHVQGSSPVPLFDFGSFGYALAIQFSDMDLTSVTNLAITLDRHLEFRTTSRIFPTAYATETLETYHAAQIALANMGQLMENPVHLAAIGGMVTRAAQLAWPYLRPLAATAANTALSWAANKLGKTFGSQATLQPPSQRKPQRKQKKISAKPAKPKPKAKRN